ncbi:hypothetical protein U1Q18_009293, partial [Sarracenia purpurea var. burkii]
IPRLDPRFANGKLKKSESNHSSSVKKCRDQWRRRRCFSWKPLDPSGPSPLFSSFWRTKPSSCCTPPATDVTLAELPG